MSAALRLLGLLALLLNNLLGCWCRLCRLCHLCSLARAYTHLLLFLEFFWTSGRMGSTASTDPSEIIAGASRFQLQFKNGQIPPRVSVSNQFSGKWRFGGGFLLSSIPVLNLECRRGQSKLETSLGIRLHKPRLKIPLQPILSVMYKRNMRHNLKVVLFWWVWWSCAGLSLVSWCR